MQIKKYIKFETILNIIILIIILIAIFQIRQEGENNKQICKDAVEKKLEESCEICYIYENEKFNEIFDKDITDQLTQSIKNNIGET